LNRAGASYTIDSLVELRQELGAGHSLCLVMGGDAVGLIETWRRWRELLDYAHLVIIARPGWHLPEDGVVADWLAAHRLTDHSALRQHPAGGIVIEELRPLDISSTEIREMLAAGRSPRYLLPESVLDYIKLHHLY
jgi:nicotinate-nucleotide adenylyltransferase